VNTKVINLMTQNSVGDLEFVKNKQTVKIASK